MADVSITASLVRAGTGNLGINTVTAGAAITAGQVIYLDTANLAQLADADGASATQTVSGIALNSTGAAGQPVSYVTTGSPAVVPGFTGTVGDVVLLSTTPGGMTVTSGDITTGDRRVVLGVMVTTTTMNFTPVVGGVV